MLFWRPKIASKLDIAWENAAQIYPYCNVNCTYSIGKRLCKYAVCPETYMNYDTSADTDAEHSKKVRSVATSTLFLQKLFFKIYNKAMFITSIELIY